ncbi:MAG TPA: hypothetical protein VMN82_16320, partial [Thermoanaerobaculia bacterium]|nr:hypothetical protein [Thermoanaerobaculia bacterium]
MPRAAAGNYLGGALGVIGALPLIPLARGAAARLVPPARLPGAERLVHDLKAATWVEAAVIVFALPGAALLFGSALPRRLGVSARLSAAWPGAAFSAALPLCRGGVRASAALAIGLILSAAACVLLRRRAGAGPTRRARRLAAAAVFSALFAATAFAYFAPDGDVDLFEEGHLLGPAQVYRAGGRP